MKKLGLALVLVGMLLGFQPANAAGYTASATVYCAELTSQGEIPVPPIEGRPLCWFNSNDDYTPDPQIIEADTMSFQYSFSGLVLGLGPKQWLSRSYGLYNEPAANANFGLGIFCVPNSVAYKTGGLMTYKQQPPGSILPVYADHDTDVGFFAGDPECGAEGWIYTIETPPDWNHPMISMEFPLPGCPDVFPADGECDTVRIFDGINPPAGDIGAPTVTIWKDEGKNARDEDYRKQQIMVLLDPTIRAYFAGLTNPLTDSISDGQGYPFPLRHGVVFRYETMTHVYYDLIEFDFAVVELDANDNPIVGIDQESFKTTGVYGFQKPLLPAPGISLWDTAFEWLGCHLCSCSDYDIDFKEPNALAFKFQVEYSTDGGVTFISEGEYIDQPDSSGFTHALVHGSDQPIYWRVRALNNGGTGGWSALKVTPGQCSCGGGGPLL